MEFKSDNLDLRTALQIVAAAVGTERLLLEGREAALMSALKAGTGEIDKIEDPAIEEAVLRIYATVDNLRLDLDEEAERDFIRALADIYAIGN